MSRTSSIRVATESRIDRAEVEARLKDLREDVADAGDAEIRAAAEKAVAIAEAKLAAGLTSA